MKDSIRLSIEWCSDKKSYHFGYRFRDSRTHEVIAECDEFDYHETVAELLAQGYTV